MSASTESRNTNVIWSSLIGTFICWYDFLIFGTATALIFGPLFFPQHGFLIPMMVFAVGFLTRPIGGAVWGWLADRLGRKKTLLTTLVVTAVSTVAIGLLPTYHDIGILASILLVALRIVQTFALGGEFASASTILAEHHVSDRYRGSIVSLTAFSFSLALIASSSVFALVGSLGKDALMDWAWRIPFLLSLSLLFVGVYLRYRVLETPSFNDLKAQSKVLANPLTTSIRTNWQKMALAIGAYHLSAAWVYVGTTFGFMYLMTTHGIPRAEILKEWNYVTWIMPITLLFFAWLGDKIGRLPLIACSAVLSMPMSFLFFQWLSQGWIFIPMLLSVAVLMCMVFASAPGFMTEIYPSNIRTTAAGLTLNIGTMIGGGLLPLIITWLWDSTQTLNALAIVFVVMSLISLLSCVALARDDNLIQIKS